MKQYEIEVKIECNARVTVVSDDEDTAIDQAIEKALDATGIDGVSPCGKVCFNEPVADFVEVKSAMDLTEYKLSDIGEAERIDLRVHGGAA